MNFFPVLQLMSFIAAATCLGMTPEAGQNPSGESFQPKPLMETMETLPWKDEFASSAEQKDHLTLAVRYVSYTDEKGKPVISAEQTRAVIRDINQVFKQCNLHFRVEDYTLVQPETVKLSYSPSKMSDLPRIRKTFDQAHRLLVVATGKWNKKGGLGADGANAWSAMPGTIPSGAVLESSVARFANIIAHELGHSLNLDHADSDTNLMNPVIYNRSKTLTSEQCQNVRETATSVRPEVLRS